MKLRLGRHNKRIVYLQDLDEPTKQDKMVAVFFTERAAAVVVDVVNHTGADAPDWWWQEFAGE